MRTEEIEHPVQAPDSFLQLHKRNSLVLAVQGGQMLGVDLERLEAVACDPQRPEPVRVGEPRHHQRNNGHPRSLLRGDGLDRLEQVRVVRRRIGSQPVEHGHFHGRAARQLFHVGDEVLFPHAREQAAVELGRRLGWNHVRLVAALKHGKRYGIEQHARAQLVLHQLSEHPRVLDGRVDIRVGGLPGSALRFADLPEVLTHGRQDVRLGRRVDDPVQRPHQLVGGRIFYRHGGVPGRPPCRDLEPEHRLLRDIHAPALRLAVAAPVDVESLINQVFGVADQILLPVDEDIGAGRAADFLVRRGQKYDVPVQFLPGPFEEQHRLQLGDAHALHVQGAASPQLAVVNLAGKRRVPPVLGASRHHVDVVQQYDRAFGPGALEAGINTGSSRGRIEQRCFYPVSPQDAGQVLGTAPLISRGVGGVYLYIGSEDAGRLVSGAGKVRRNRLYAGPRGRDKNAGGAYGAEKAEQGSDPHWQSSRNLGGQSPGAHAQTKTPPELNRGGVFATAWLPVAMQAQYLLTLQPVLHVRRAHLLRFPVSADLTSPQGPSGRCGDSLHRSPLMTIL